MFVHGYTCSHEDWHLQFDSFSKTNEAVACDLRAHGATPGREHECSIEHYGGDVAALLANLEFNKCILIGHSMGCRVVLEAARLAPERVSGLILIDGSRLGSGDPDEAETAVRRAIESGGYRPFAESLFRQMFLRPSAEAEAIVARALRLPEDTAAALMRRMVRWDAQHLDAALGALRVPLLVIQSTRISSERNRVPMKRGENSPWFDLVRKHVPGARIEVIPDTGHFPQLEAAETVNRLIRGFLATRIS